MARYNLPSWLSKLFGNQMADILAAAGVVLILGIIVISVPPSLLSVLLAFNISLALVILLISFYILQPLDFSTFPTVLLMATLFRLALNLASTRLILGVYPGNITEKAGIVIRFFGEVVAKNDPVVGLVVFLILIIIQFIVITKGAGRIAEVAARFTLDAMPGKQMAIDADLNSGLITEQEARDRRSRISREADFYGAMDGASKFVRGDAIAGIIITVINIIGGFIVGFWRESMAPGEIFYTYTILTIGDGLVTQIPALLVATAAGVVVTRAASDASLGKNLHQQLQAQPIAFFLSAGTLAILGLFGLASTAKAIFIPLFLMAIGIGIVGYIFSRNLKTEAVEKKQKEVAAAEKAKGPEVVEQLLHIDPMEIEIGYGLIPLVDVAQKGDLLNRVTSIRRQTALDLGIVVPPIRIRDNMQLPPNEYDVRIHGLKVGSGVIYCDKLLVMNPGGEVAEVTGIDTKEPAFGLPARWINSEERDKAERLGYNIITPSVVIATHITQIIKKHADMLLTRQAVQSLIDTLRETSPVIVDELIPDLVPVGVVQKVLQLLLLEEVPIRNLEQIFEALADNASRTRQPHELVEYVRMSLGRVITQKLLSPSGELHVIVIDGAIEQKLMDALNRAPDGTMPTLAPDVSRLVIDSIKESVEKAIAGGYKPVILVHPHIRSFVRNLTVRVLPNLSVISYNEVSASMTMRSVAIARLKVEDQKVSST